MAQKSQIIQCQCGAIYVTKKTNSQYSFCCPECGQSPEQKSKQNSFNRHQSATKKGERTKLGAKLQFVTNRFSFSTVDRYGYFKLNNIKLLGAQIYIHWLVLAASTLILVVYRQSPLGVALALISYLGIIFIHEVGHAAMANKVGCRVLAIRIALIHGVCEYEEPRYELDDIKIAWSGVVLQVMVAALVFYLSSLGLANYVFFAPILVFLGYFSLLIVPYNLIPQKGFDGHKAWRIIPFIYNHYFKK